MSQDGLNCRGFQELNSTLSINFSTYSNAVLSLTTQTSTSEPIASESDKLFGTSVAPRYCHCNIFQQLQGHSTSSVIFSRSNTLPLPAVSVPSSQEPSNSGLQPSIHQSSAVPKMSGRTTNGYKHKTPLYIRRSSAQWDRDTGMQILLHFNLHTSTICSNHQNNNKKP